MTVRAEVVAARPELCGRLVPAGAEAGRGPPSGDGPGEEPGPADTAARRERVPLVTAGGAGVRRARPRERPGPAARARAAARAARARAAGRAPARVQAGRGARVLAARVRSAEAVRTTKRDESVSCQFFFLVRVSRVRWTANASFPVMDWNTAAARGRDAPLHDGRGVATPPALRRYPRGGGAGHATPARRRRAPVRRSRAPPRESGGRGGVGLLRGCRVDGETTPAIDHGRGAEEGERGGGGTHPAPSPSRSNASSLRNIGASVRVARAQPLRGLGGRQIAGRRRPRKSVPRKVSLRHPTGRMTKRSDKNV